MSFININSKIQIVIIIFHLIAGKCTASCNGEVTTGNAKNEYYNIQHYVKSIEEQSKQLEKVLKDTVSFLGEELDIIIDWETRAENLDDKLKDKIYSVKLMKMFIPLKNIFIRKLQKLQDVAQMFINQPESLFD